MYCISLITYQLYGVSKSIVRLSKLIRVVPVVRRRDRPTFCGVSSLSAVSSARSCSPCAMASSSSDTGSAPMDIFHTEREPVGRGEPRHFDRRHTSVQDSPISRGVVETSVCATA